MVPESLMYNYVQLGATTVEAGRPFTHYEANQADLDALCKMAARLRALLLETSMAPDQAFPITVELTHGDSLRLRIVLAQWTALNTASDLAVVGFFGRRRAVVDPQIDVEKDTVDLELISEFPEHPGVLSYSSMELECSNYGNLVLLADPSAADRWQSSARHSRATRRIAPNYYSNVRLHNGVIRGGLLSGNDVVLVRTKYYDYEGAAPWFAVREYAAA
jgi:hypothetical protein